MYKIIFITCLILFQLCCKTEKKILKLIRQDIYSDLLLNNIKNEITNIEFYTNEEGNELKVENKNLSIYQLKLLDSLGILNLFNLQTRTLLISNNKINKIIIIDTIAYFKSNVKKIGISSSTNYFTRDSTIVILKLEGIKFNKNLINMVFSNPYNNYIRDYSFQINNNKVKINYIKHYEKPSIRIE